MVSNRTPSIYLALVFFLCIQTAQCRIASAPAQFVFGDSLVDQGNNNNLGSIAKANFYPNGIDLKLSNGRATGRFSNGRIVSDFLSEAMGVEPVLAYYDAGAHGSALLRGCNFASAGSGILDDTGNIFIQHITIPQQLTLFQKVKAEITSLVGPAAANELFTSALYSFTIGGNDFINNYALIGSQRKSQYPDYNVYSDVLISIFKGQVEELYKLGARKISVASIGPLGCIPSQLAMGSKNGECVKLLNDYALSFNSRLPAMLDTLRAELTGATIIASNSYDIIMDYVMNPTRYGFVSGNVACCGTGRFKGSIPCTLLSQVCSNRDEYLFWDPFHPTDKANEIVSQRLLYGPVSDVSPINVSQLIDL